MKTENYTLTDDAARLLHGLLLDHLENLIHGEYGEDWRAEEIELSEILIETFESVAKAQKS